jgi:hypothetical protein
MIELKLFYDAAQAASSEVLRVAGEIEAAFKLGTDEGMQQAMALKSTLDDAEAKASQANELYQSMVKAASTGAAAAKFVPVSSATQTQDKKVITRADYENLDFQARHKFFEDGGSVVDALGE